MIYFTADQHFAHQNIIKYCNRPFKTIQEMHNAFVSNWNNTVEDNDIVYVLGDFCLGTISEINHYLVLLKGRKILIRGNHDYRTKANWVSVHKKLTIYEQGITISMRHKRNERIVTDERRWHLYGHSHAKHPHFFNYSCNIGVDAWNYSPVSFETLKERFKNENKL